MNTKNWSWKGYNYRTWNTSAAWGRLLRTALGIANKCSSSTKKTRRTISTNGSEMWRAWRKNNKSRNAKISIITASVLNRIDSDHLCLRGLVLTTNSTGARIKRLKIRCSATCGQIWLTKLSIKYQFCIVSSYQIMNYHFKK